MSIWYYSLHLQKHVWGNILEQRRGREYIVTFGVTCITCNFDDWIDRLAIVTTSRGFKIAWCISLKYFVRGLNFGFFSCSSWTKFMCAHCSKFRETISCWNCLETLPTEKSPDTFLSHIFSTKTEFTIAFLQNIWRPTSRCWFRYLHSMSPGNTKQKKQKWAILSLVFLANVGPKLKIVVNWSCDHSKRSQDEQKSNGDGFGCHFSDLQAIFGHLGPFRPFLANFGPKFKTVAD